MPGYLRAENATGCGSHAFHLCSQEAEASVLREFEASLFYTDFQGSQGYTVKQTNKQTYNKRKRVLPESSFPLPRYWYAKGVSALNLHFFVQIKLRLGTLKVVQASE